MSQECELAGALEGLTIYVLYHAWMAKRVSSGAGHAAPMPDILHYDLDAYMASKKKAAVAAFARYGEPVPLLGLSPACVLMTDG